MRGELESLQAEFRSCERGLENVRRIEREEASALQQQRDSLRTMDSQVGAYIRVMYVVCCMFRCLELWLYLCRFVAMFHYYCCIGKPALVFSRPALYCCCYIPYLLV